MQNPNLERTLRTAKVITGAMMASMLVYVLVAEFYIVENIKLSFSQYSTIKYILYALTGIEVLVIILFNRNRFLLRGKSSSQRLGNQNPDNQNMGNSIEARENAFGQQLLSTTIITFALCESIAIYGVVLFILGKQRQDLYIMVGLSLLLMLVYFPSSEKWRNRLEQFRMRS